MFMFKLIFQTLYLDTLSDNADIKNVFFIPWGR